MSAAEVVRTVTVTGTASTTVRPDRASLSLGVQSRRPSAQSAMAVVDERAATVVSALRDAGAQDADLRTTGLNLWFDQSDRSYVAGYSLNVTIPPDDVGRFIDAAAEVAGDELTLNGVSFSVADPAAAVAPLRELALADARAKAEVLAAAAACSVGTVVTIVEGGGGGAVPVLRGAVARAMAAPVEPGTESLSLQVTVTSELIPE
jgi:uncharacterized protein